VVVGQEHVGWNQETVLGAKHLLELEDAVTVVVISQPDRVRTRRVDERAPDAALLDEAHLERAAALAQVGDLDHLLTSKVPDRDLAAEAGRVDTSSAQRRRPERRADAAVGLEQRIEVVHVRGTEVAGIAHRARAEMPLERARAIVDLDDAAWLCRVGRRPDHGDDRPAVRGRNHAVRDDVATLRGQLVVDCSQGHLLAVAFDLEDVDPV